MNFSDINNEKRFAIRHELEKTGAECMGYFGKNAVFAIEKGRLSETLQAINRLGLEHDGKVTYFPLCSDKPREAFRHNGNWCYLHVFPGEHYGQ